jgi:hypothetical protein
MKIQKVISLVENVLYEISQSGAISSTGLTDEDFNELQNFLRLVNEYSNKRNESITLREVNAGLNLLRTRNARDYVFGVSNTMKASHATSGERGDVEKRSAAFAGPDEKRNVPEERAEKTTMVAQVLDKMGYIDIDEERQKIQFTDPSGLSRVRNFLQITVDQLNINSPSMALKRFDEIKRVYQNLSRKRMAGTGGEEEFEGASIVKQITPNILIFLSQVAKNYKRKKSWDTYLNPAQFKEVDPKVKGYFEYDPRTAAETLVSMGLAVKGENGYLLNKDKIRQVVSSAREKIYEMMKGSKVENPIHKSGPPSQSEQQARNFINFMRKSFSDQVWENAQKHVFAAMREYGGDAENALQWYLGAKDSVGQDDRESGISEKLSRVDKTVLGTAINLATAKYIAKKMMFDASTVLGQNKQRPSSFVTKKDLAPAASAYRSGTHKKPARV